MSVDLEQALRRQGGRYHELAERTRGDLTDVNRRTGRQRNRRRAAAGSTLAVGVLLAALTLNRAPDRSSVEQFGTVPTTVSPSTETVPTTEVTTSTTGPTSSTTMPTTTVPPSSTTGSPPLPDIRTVDFGNATFPADTCAIGGIAEPPRAGFPLRNNRWDGDTFDYVAIEQPIAYGDVTGDGHDEAAVMITCSTGVGSGTFVHPWLYTPDAAAPTRGRRLPFAAITESTLSQMGLAGGSVRGGRASFSGGSLVIEWSVRRADEPPIAPGQVVTTRQRWTGTAWQATGPPTARPATADP